MCCFALDYAFPPNITSEPIEFVDGYGLAPWSDGGYALVDISSATGDRNVTITNIVRIGWNNDYIVLESKIVEQEWHIYGVTTKKYFHCGVKGVFDDNCNSFIEFQALKIKLGIPESLQMRDADDVYEELKQK